MNILEKLKLAIDKLETETGKQVNCITLHPEHLKEIKETSHDLLVELNKKKEPGYKLHIPGLEPIEAFLAESDPDYSGESNTCLQDGYSIVGVLDYKEDMYLHIEEVKL